MRTVIGIIVASIVLYVWGFLVWGGPFPYHTRIWKSAAAAEAAAELIRQQFPVEGVYYVPSMVGEMSEIEAKFQRGPIAFVHVLDADGRPMMDTSIMVKGFVLNVICVGLIALLLQMIQGALPSYGDRVKAVALIGLTAALLIEIGDHVWWGIDLRWKLYQAFYTCTAWIVTGLVLAAFIKPEPPSTSDDAASAAA